MSHKILVVDDSRTVRVQLARILSDAGYETIVASDGREALALVKEVEPKLMILDIQMPEMDGYAVCQELKTMPGPCSQLPVVFLTCLESRALDLLGDAMGAYLRKPVVRDDLLEAVTRFVDPICEATPS